MWLSVKALPPAQIALAWLLCAEAVDRADPRYYKIAFVWKENLGAVAVELTSDDLGEIDAAVRDPITRRAPS